jgi:hypothetical protein
MVITAENIYNFFDNVAPQGLAAALDEIGGPVNHHGDFGSKFGRAKLLELAFGLFRPKPLGIAVVFEGRNQALHFTQMRVHQNRVPAGAAPAGLAMTISDKWDALHRAVYAGLFVSFAGGGIGVSGVLIHSTFGKSPVAIPGADQQEFQFAIAQPITHGGDVHTI